MRRLTGDEFTRLTLEPPIFPYTLDPPPADDFFAAALDAALEVADLPDEDDAAYGDR